MDKSLLTTIGSIISGVIMIMTLLAFIDNANDEAFDQFERRVDMEIKKLYDRQERMEKLIIERISRELNKRNFGGG